jgi:hypothetical protein
VPFLGPILAALFSAVLAFAFDPRWSMLLWVIALFVAMEIVSGNVSSTFRDLTDDLHFRRGCLAPTLELADFHGFSGWQ